MMTIELLEGVEASEVLEASRRLLSGAADGGKPHRAGCHVQPVRWAAMEQLEDLLEDGDFSLETTFKMTADWQSQAGDLLAASSEAEVLLGYEWGWFRVSRSGSRLRMRRYGEGRRLMRQGVGMFVRRYLRPLLEAGGWHLESDECGAVVSRSGRPVGRLRSADDKFSEWADLELESGLGPELSRVACRFLAEIRTDPKEVSGTMSGSFRHVLGTAQALGLEDQSRFSYGTLGAGHGFATEGRVLDLMQTLSGVGSDGDVVYYPEIRWQGPGFEAEGGAYLELRDGLWSLSVAFSEGVEPLAVAAVESMVAKPRAGDS